MGEAWPCEGRLPQSGPAAPALIGGNVPTPADIRTACYAILAIARIEKDRAVKRVLASDAFALAQKAQLQAWAENGGPPNRLHP